MSNKIGILFFIGLIFGLNASAETKEECVAKAEARKKECVEYYGDTAKSGKKGHFQQHFVEHVCPMMAARDLKKCESLGGM